MFRETHIMPVLSVSDLARARQFYCDTLGLKEVRTTGDGGLILAGASGEMLELSPRSEVTPTGRTVLTFEVDDVENAVHDLEARGVGFEDYAEPGLKTEHHIAQFGNERAAWFKDPDGNVLCMHQLLH